ncbi:MAG: hypothetical protein CMH30_05970 [Micavibrio sp.]|nr:hypothetical protein [Micavibrio sp.]|tara:strand:- start:211 stop:639 length:429 start_codon:yes stop_codon:yes gene_type:complete
MISLKKLLFIAALCFITPAAHATEYEDYDIAVLQSLDKITARTATFEAKIGSTLSYGQVYMKVMACKKTPPFEKPESAAFIKIWEVEAGKAAEWIFSGWMFASSPSISAMDHPIYDVWLLDCKNSETSKSEPSETVSAEEPQ